MNNINTEKTRRVIDGIICVAASAIYAYITWASGRHINLSFVVRLALVLWLTIILVRGVRLLQYMTTFDIDLTRYMKRDLDNIEIPFKYKFKEWKTYLKKPFKISWPFAVAVPLIYITNIFINIPVDIYFAIVNLLVIGYITTTILATVTEMRKHIATFIARYRPVTEEQNKTELNGHILHGLAAGLVFIVCLIFISKMPAFHYVLYYFSFSLLYSFSTILMNLYQLFSRGVYSVLGHEYDQIPLKTGYPHL